MANERKPGPDTNNVPDADGRNRDLRKNRRPMAGAGDEPRGVERDIADADKKVRTGSTDESVRDTPPFGEFDEPPFVPADKPPRDEKGTDRKRH
jgi:hypothetical protein